VELIKKLGELKKAGIINNKEFQAKKNNSLTESNSQIKTKQCE